MACRWIRGAGPRLWRSNEGRKTERESGKGEARKVLLVHSTFSYLEHTKSSTYSEKKPKIIPPIAIDDLDGLTCHATNHL